MVVRGRPIARARSVVPVPVRPSATQRVPKCVCVKLREYATLTLARVMLHRYEVQYIRACVVGPDILGLLLLYSLARQPYFPCFSLSL